MFDQKGVDHSIRFANHQQNARSAFTTQPKVKLVWEKALLDEYPHMSLVPRAVLVQKEIIGVQASQNLMIYRSPGVFQYMLPIAENSPVVFAKEALSYFHSSLHLGYKDYAGNDILKELTVPGYEQWAVMLLFKPGIDEYISVAQFTGGPMQREGPRPSKRYVVCRQPTQEFFPAWSFDGEGQITHALLSNDQKQLILLQPTKVLVHPAQAVLLNTLSGAIERDFNIDFNFIAAASLDTMDRLLIVGHGKKGKGERNFLACVALDGKELWSYELRRPLVHQPPACGTDGRVFIITAEGIACVKEGQLIWKYLVKADLNTTWISVTQDNAAIIINNGHLIVLDQKGAETYNARIGSTEEQFNAPAALDVQGRIYVASNQKLYCYE